MPNYQNGKIYMIWCEDDKYYGSTTETLSRRMSGHRTHYKTKYNNCSSFIIFEKYGIENCKIELVELVPCNSLEELRAREGYYIRNNECINNRIANRTRSEYRNDNKEQTLEKQKQYCEENKEKIAENKKKYYQDNREYILQRQKQYREDNKEQISQQQKKYDKENKENKKKYNQDNREYILQRQKKYYQANKEKLAQQERERYQAKQLRCKILENNLITELDGEATSS